MSITAKIFTKPNCPFCVDAKALLKNNGIPYDELTVGKDVTKEDIQEMVDAMNVHVKVRTVPQIFFIHEDARTTYIGGFNELNKYVQHPTLGE